MSTSVPYPGPTDSPVTDVDERAERGLWWLAVLASVSGIVLGLLMLVWPEATLAVVAVLFGGWLLAQGIVHIVQSFTRSGLDVIGRILRATLGVLFIVAGLICLRNLFTALAVIVTFIGIAWVIAGIVELVSAFTGSRRAGNRVWHGVFGALSIVGGLAVMIWPAISLATLVYITAIWTIVLGMVQLVLLIRARRLVAA